MVLLAPLPLAMQSASQTDIARLLSKPASNNGNYVYQRIKEDITLKASHKTVTSNASLDSNV